MSSCHLLVRAAVVVVCSITPLAIASLPLLLVGPTALRSDSARSGPTPRTKIAKVGEMVPQSASLDLWENNDLSRPIPNWGTISDGDEERPARPVVRRRAFRTLCVRLCDGFYWPVSFATRRDRLGHDARQCERTCPGRGRLFVHRNPGEGVNDMVDLDGRPYRKLAAAFLYRSQRIADCTCRGYPWEEEALAQHRAYAEEAKTKASAKAR